MTTMNELNERLAKIETRLARGDDQWSDEELREIVDKTDLVPEMDNQGLIDIGPRFEKLFKRIENLGKTDFNEGIQTLEFRLSVIEGSIDILCGQHFGYTGSKAMEFNAAHGIQQGAMRENLLDRIEGIQKKLDRLLVLHKDETFTVSMDTAMRVL